jgi:hypothetical protein
MKKLALDARHPCGERCGECVSGKVAPFGAGFKPLAAPHRRCEGPPVTQTVRTVARSVGRHGQSRRLGGGWPEATPLSATRVAEPPIDEPKLPQCSHDLQSRNPSSPWRKSFGLRMSRMADFFVGATRSYHCGYCFVAPPRTRPFCSSSLPKHFRHGLLAGILASGLVRNGRSRSHPRGRRFGRGLPTPDAGRATLAGSVIAIEDLPLPSLPAWFHSAGEPGACSPWKAGSPMETTALGRRWHRARRYGTPRLSSSWLSRPLEISRE